MLILDGANDVIRIVTATAVSTIYAIASYVDKDGTTYTPGNKVTSITAATTTTVAAAPGTSKQRTIQNLSIRNSHATARCNVTIQIYDGSNAFELKRVTLGPGDNLILDETGNWVFTTVDPLLITSQVLQSGSAATYTTPDGTSALIIECIGGGGGGGGCATAVTNGAGAGGGGGGAYSKLIINNPSATYTYTVGAGGSGGTAGANNGSVGSDTNFGTTLCVAKGGSGGLSDSVATLHVGGLGGAGGLASGGTGDIKIDGKSGMYGASVAAAQAVGGYGGSSNAGGAAASVRNTTATGVSAGTNTGAGGGGACIVSGGASQAGGVGGSGVIWVTEIRC